MQVGECSDYKFNHNSVAQGSDLSDVSTEGSNQREVPVSTFAPDEQQPSKNGIILSNSYVKQQKIYLPNYAHSM